MGVMACDRNNCKNILCDTYVDNIGYICYDCQREFKIFLKSKELVEPLPNDVLRNELRVFMKTEKDTYKENEITVDEFFRNNT